LPLYTLKDPAPETIMKNACLLLAALANFATPALAAAPSYKLTKSVALGAPDAWDYVVFDAASGRVFIGHSTETTIVDGTSGAIVGHFAGLNGAHGTAIDAKLGRGFADSGKDPSVTAFDLKTFQPIAGGKITTPEDTDGMGFDPSSGHVFTMNGDAGSASIIDPATAKLVVNIPLDGKPEYADADGHGHIYANIEDKGQLAVIDTATNKVTAHWPLPGCTSPHGLAVDGAGRRVFSSCANGKLMVVNADSGAIVASFPIGLGSDAVAYDPVRHRVFSSNGSGTLSVIVQNSADSYDAPVEIPTTRGARTMAVDPKSGRIFLVAADYVEDPTVPVTNRRHYKVVPGTARLMLLDPAS
jgi:DNA-binding beta-propeller fold protein YncE